MIPFPQLIFYMAGGRITCTCGCEKEVTYATKQNHLNALGKVHLRARVVSEVVLNRNTQQQKSAPLLQRGVKKRASSNSYKEGSQKRRNATQLDENELPESHASSQVDTNLVEDLLPPVVKSTDQQSRFIERSRGVMEMRWMTSRRNGGSHFDGEDEDEDEEEEPPFYASEIPGISNWDLLGEDFEREAAALGWFSLYKLST